MARIKKIKINGFTIIDNDVINDERMHLKALGLYAYMWSKPDNWQFYINEIASHFKDGESAVSSAMKELMNLGYLKRTQNRKDGRFANYDYVLQEFPKQENHGSVPKGDFPKSEKPIPKKTNPENRGLLNTDHTNTDLSNTEEVLSGDQHSVKDVFELWEQNWGFPNGIARQDLTEWVNRFGTDLVLHAITFALRRNINSKGADRYLARTFERYQQEGITTVEQAEKRENQHQQQASREYGARSFNKPKRREPIPEWMRKDFEDKSKRNPDPRIQHGYVMPDDSMESIPK